MAASTTTSSALAAAAVLLCASVFLAAHPADGRHHVAEGHQNPKAGDGDYLVAKMCKNATGFYYTPRLTTEFCISALRSDERSAAAKHPRDLALVAVDLLERGATVAAAKVAAVAKGSNHSKDTELVVQFCRMDYENVARAVPLCGSMAAEYELPKPGHGCNLRAFDNFVECGERVSNPAVECWLNIFFDGKVKEAAGKEVVEAVHRANLADAMLNLAVFVDVES